MKPDDKKKFHDGRVAYEFENKSGIKRTIKVIIEWEHQKQNKRLMIE